MNNNNEEKATSPLSFYKNKTVLVSGHTGFKGTWLTRILLTAGAKVIGYSLSAQRIRTCSP
jgi:GDP-D-mannose dehydratase